MSNSVTFGSYLRELRKIRKISQEVLAEELGVTRQAYSYYELDKCEPSMDILRKIANFHKISIEKLFIKGEEAINDTVMNKLESKVLRIFGLLSAEDQKEIYELIIEKLTRTVRIFMF